ncbi:MAG TPA: cysteine desulfurase [Candidatus Omnitrophota bacterium]|nr:cysteine desulfurase [Candidatus Omnitrophota bacterium]
MPMDIEKIRSDFPNLRVKVHGKPLVYLDNAATTLKPQQVIERITWFYSQGTSNVHRGVHYLSEQATAEYERTREKIKKFINASKTAEVIFTSGATESINLVMNSYGKSQLKQGDEILISEMEHHSNIVPWQQLCQENGCVLKVAPINDNGELCLDAYKAMLSPKVKLVSMVYISNSLGTVNPVMDIITTAHEHGAVVLIDGAQAAGHLAMDVQELDCDFLVFSGHKIFGPTGTGVLYGKADLLNRMPPYQTGGDMITSVTFEKTTYNILPYKFEAGTPNIAGVIGLGAAIDYMLDIGMDAIAAYERELLAYGTEKLGAIPGLKIIGTAKDKAAIISFILPNIHAHDLGTLVDEEGVAVRTGHHCTQPVMNHFKVPATSRASLCFYNTKEEIDILADAIRQAKTLFP